MRPRTNAEQYDGQRYLPVSRFGGGMKLRSRSPSIQAKIPDTAIIAAPFGFVALSATEEFLVGIDFVTEPRGEGIPRNPVLESAILQLNRYFDDPATRFSLPLRLIGTDYARRVWSALIEISPGNAETYGSLALRLESGPRAVAGACRANAFPILIPCHRVISARGLGGYCGRMSGPFLDIKRWLLTHEGRSLD